MSVGLDLSTLVVEEGGVPAERLDDALQRQVLSGGGLDTVLLEMGLVDEATLLRLLARTERLPAIGKDALDSADRAAVAMFPRRLAEKHGIVPLSLEGRVLSVAVSRAPDMTLLDEIGFMLSVYVRPYVTTEVRIAYALQRLYGVPLSPRHETVLALLGEDTGELGPVDDPPAPAGPHPNPHESGAGWAVVSAGLAVPDGQSDAEGARASARPATAAATLLGGAPQPADGAVAPASPDEERAPTAEEARQRLEARVAADEAAERAREDERRDVRVRWTVDDAIAELALTDDRDAMLDVTLRFAYRRLSTAAIFVVQRVGAGRSPSFVLWDLIHPTLRRSDLPHLTVSTSDGNALSRLYEIRSPFLGPIAEDDPLVEAFGARPRAAVLVPIVVGDVLAGVLYGDNGAKAIPPSSLAELHMVVPRLGAALRNLILRQKRAAADEEALEAARAVAVEPRAVETAVPVIEVELDFDSSLEGDAEVDLDSVIDGMSAASPGSFSQTGEPVEEDADEDAEAPSEPAAVAAEATTTPAAPPTSEDEIDDSEEESIDARLLDPAAFEATGARVSAVASLVDAAGVAAPLEEARRDPAPTPTPEEASPSDAEERKEPEREPQTEPEPEPQPEPAPQEPEHSAVEAAPPPKRPRHVPPPLPKKRRPPVDTAASPSPAAGPRASDEEVAVAEAPATPPASFAAAPVVSPGANARESLLLATWRDWLKFEDNDTDELLGALQQPGEAGRMAASAVVAKGNDAMPSLARYFPGVLAVHPFGPMETRPDVPEFSDATACLVRLGADRAAPILVGELGNDDRLHRYTAVWCLSELRVPAALPRLAQRAFDPEVRIALLALEVLEGYRDVPGFEKVVSWLRDFLRRGDAFQRKRAILAAAELSDREALEPLVNLLGTRPKEIAEEARRALVEITLQDFGFSERRWRAWIADNLRHPRTAWLLEGLAQKDIEIRERAQQELNRLTGENFGYRADAPRKDREAALKVWSAWWSEQAEGRWP